MSPFATKPGSSMPARAEDLLTRPSLGPDARHPAHGLQLRLPVDAEAEDQSGKDCEERYHELRLLRRNLLTYRLR